MIKIARLSSFFIIVGVLQSASASDRVAVDTIVNSIFIGQAYVSRNAYLKGFSDEQQTGWPEHVVASRLRPQDKKHSTQRLELTFSRVVNATGSDEYSNFPTKERAPGQVDSNRSPDVFCTVLDSALEDRDIGVYRTKQPILDSFSVLAWSSALSLDATDFADNGKPRPMTKAKRREVAIEKKKIETKTKDYECTTVPAFLDSAKEILTSKVKGTEFSIRISEYSNPGCGGHLEEVYVLDIWEIGKEPSRFEYHHYYGAI